MLEQVSSRKPKVRKNMTGNHKNRAYWMKNLQYLSTLLVVWFVVSYGCAILFVNYLDKIKIGGFRLGFWFAQQGSIYVFVALIFIYVYLMNRLDKRYSETTREENE
jgi:putative solute:sodium symporter small subunit